MLGVFKVEYCNLCLRITDGMFKGRTDVLPTWFVAPSRKILDPSADHSRVTQHECICQVRPIIFCIRDLHFG